MPKFSYYSNSKYINTIAVWFMSSNMCHYNTVGCSYHVVFVNKVAWPPNKVPNSSEILLPALINIDTDVLVDSTWPCNQPLYLPIFSYLLPHPDIHHTPPQPPMDQWLGALKSKCTAQLWSMCITSWLKWSIHWPGFHWIQMSVSWSVNCLPVWPRPVQNIRNAVTMNSPILLCTTTHKLNTFILLEYYI